MFDSPGAQAAPWIVLCFAAWWLGEWTVRRTALPRVAVYAAAGLVCSVAAAGLGLPVTPPELVWWFARLGLMLLLFEVGCRINPGWFVRNPALLATGLLNAALCFVACFAVAQAFGYPADIAGLVASVCVAASPVALVRVVADTRAGGLATERALHLAAVSAVLAALLVKSGAGVWMAAHDISLLDALATSVRLLFGSALAGGLLGWGLPIVLRPLRLSVEARATGVALGLVLLLLLGEMLQVSPLISALAAGVAARHATRAIPERHWAFGTLGDFGTLALFILAAAVLPGGAIAATLLAGLALVAARQLAHLAAALALAHWSATPWRKAALSSVALAPMSGFAVLLLDAVRGGSPGYAESGVLALAGALALLEVLGPLAACLALRVAGETDARRS